jgi:hypothetical protein
MMNSLLRATLLPVATLLLSGCLYDNPPSGPSRSIDTALVGQWETIDRSGQVNRVTVTPSSSDHYRIVWSGNKGTRTLGFDAWLGRVDDFSILVLKSLDGQNEGKYLLLHHELLSPGFARPGEVGATRIRVSELQLDPSAATLDPYHLRRDIRDALKAGTLLAPYDVVTDRKSGGVKTPGSVIWTKTGGVTLKGETF